MAVKRRIPLHRHEDEITRWVGEGKTDEWIASALGTSPSSVQSFRSRNGIYRRGLVPHAPPEPRVLAGYEGVLEAQAEEGPAVWFDPAVADHEAYRRRWGGRRRVRITVSAGRIVVG